MSDRQYAGDISASEAWQILGTDASAVLIDVRTVPERQFVGIPDLSPVGKRLLQIDWQVYPQMDVNGHFAASVADAGVPADATVLLLCRSGQRSRAAAIELTQRGYWRCLNVADGFEGPLDDTRHRGSRGGWKHAGLPWVQS